MKNNYVLSTFNVLVGIIFLSTISFSSSASASTTKFGNLSKTEETLYSNDDIDNKADDGEDSTKGKDLKDCDDLHPISKSVPEPFTVMGTLVGGAVALRTRNKLKAKAS